MSPQAPSFNRGVWKKLETLLRGWAKEYDGILIVTGPVLESYLPKIGPEGVSVPNRYYKVVLDGDSISGWKAIAFLLSNNGSSEPLESFVVTIDEVERMTGIDFFPFLPDNDEEKLEAAVHVKDWIWTGGNNMKDVNALRDNSLKGGTEGTAVQCSGITKKGARCRNRTTDPSGRCYLHR
jgi:endonuclease G